MQKVTRCVVHLEDSPEKAKSQGREHQWWPVPGEEWQESDTKGQDKGTSGDEETVLHLAYCCGYTITSAVKQLHTKTYSFTPKQVHFPVYKSELKTTPNNPQCFLK